MNSILVIPKSGVESVSVTDSEERMFFFFCRVRQSGNPRYILSQYHNTIESLFSI